MDSIKLPTKPDEEFYTHNWNDDELQTWLDETVRVLQQGHVNDNADTKTYKYDRSDSDMILLRLCIMYYGQRNGYANLLQGYKSKEKRQLKPIIKLLKQHCTQDIEFNIVYVSVGTKANDGSFASQEIPLLRLEDSGKIIDTSDPNCLYESYEKYLNKNKLQKSVMIYPQEATYAVESGITVLKARESPSSSEIAECLEIVNIVIRVASVATTYLTPACVFGGPALASMATRTSLAGSYWSTTLTKVSSVIAKIPKPLMTFNKLINVSSRVISVTNMIEKVSRHEEVFKIVTSALLAALSAITGRYCQKFQNAVMDGKTYEEFSKTINKYEKIMLHLARLIPTVTSVTTIIASFINLLENSDRSMLDISAFCILLFMFTNTIVQPWTVKQMFDAAQDTLISELQKKVKQYINATPEATVQRAYLVKTLYRIEDLEGFYGHMTKTKSTVTFTKNGFVLNNNKEMSAEFYNHIGKKGIIIQQIKEKKLLNKGAKADKEIENFMNHYDPELVQSAKDYANEKMTVEEKKEFFKKLSNIGTSREEKLFDASASFKDTPGFLEATTKAERNLCGGKTLEELTVEHQNLEKYKTNTPDYDQKLSELNKKIMAAEKVRAERNEFQNSLGKINNKNAVNNNFTKEILTDECGGKDFIIKTEKFIKDTATFLNARTERLTTHHDSAVVKHSLQHAFGVPDYKDIKINGQAVFKDLSDTELRTMSGYFLTPEKAKNMINASAKLLHDKECTWNGNSADEIAGGIKLLGQYVDKVIKGTNLKSDDVLQEIATGQGQEYKKAKAFLIDVKKGVKDCYANNPDCQQYRDCYTAAAHYLKHDPNQIVANFNADNLKEYLVTNNNAIFAPNNLTSQRYSQNITSIDKNYVYRFVDQTTQPIRTRRYFGVSTTGINGNTTITTVFEK